MSGNSTRPGQLRVVRGRIPGRDTRVPVLPVPPAWTADAVCAQTDPELFFPEKGGPTREAKAVCAGCVVRAECLAYALEHHIRHGVWGGLSERQRRQLRGNRPGRPPAEQHGEAA